MVLPCGMYKVEQLDSGAFDVYPVIGISLSHERLFSNLPSATDADAAVREHALGAVFEWVKLTPNVWLMQRPLRNPTSGANANVVAGSASAAAKPVPAATPTEMMASAADSDDDIEDGELYDLFGD